MQSDIERRREAMARAKTNSALDGFEPSAFGLSVFEQWISGHWTTDEAVTLLIQHHQGLEKNAARTDNTASPNKLGITDHERLQLRMADMDAEG